MTRSKALDRCTGCALRRVRGLVLLVVTGLMTGCASIGYYGQAIAGHWSLMQRRVPVADVIRAPATDAEIRRKLELTQRARTFATHELQLPDNGSYRHYADLRRPYVVWNVFAAPKLSLEPVTSCFLFVGCLDYRGYFDEAKAIRYAARLRAAGHDVFVAGVAAYSTLGWFDDPVLNTMLVWDHPRIVEVIFHELAHQRIYVEDDSVFNESFATALAEFGVERFIADAPALRQRYTERDRREAAFHALLLDFRARLEAVYAGTESDAEKLAQKNATFRALLEAYEDLKRGWNGYTGYDDWMYQDLNNAKLASVVTYHDYVPGFRTILQTVDGDLTRFYAIVESLARSPRDTRRRCLTTSNAGPGCPDELVGNQ